MVWYNVAYNTIMTVVKQGSVFVLTQAYPISHHGWAPSRLRYGMFCVNILDNNASTCCGMNDSNPLIYGSISLWIDIRWNRLEKEWYYTQCIRDEFHTNLEDHFPTDLWINNPKLVKITSVPLLIVLIQLCHKYAHIKVVLPGTGRSMELIVVEISVALHTSV